jgi:hypothetical protein
MEKLFVEGFFNHKSHKRKKTKQSKVILLGGGK